MKEQTSHPAAVLKCSCGNVLDLNRFLPGETFACPACRTAHVTPQTPQDLARASTLVALSSDRSPGEALREIIARAALPPGTQLGRYSIERELGRGGMGVVYLARDPGLKRAVAIKLLPHSLTLPEEVREQFRTEARTAARIKHPNVAVIYSMEEERNAIYFAMEYVEGETLAAAIDRQRRLEPQPALRIIRAVAEGLRAALQHGVIHRDIKPSNIMFDPEGRPKITDFGLAKIGGAGMDVGRRGAVLGTPYYMSPEQGNGDPVDFRTDIYSLGVTLFETLSGQPPFQGANPIEILLCHASKPLPELPGVPAPAVRIVRRLMAKKPEDRPSSYDELIDEVDRAIQELKTGGGAHTVLSAEESDKESLGSMLRSQIALARVNLEMGRFEKAEKIYDKLLGHDGRVRIEAALHLGEIYERKGEFEPAATQWRTVIEESAQPAEVAYARWKLGNHLEQRATSVNEEAIRIYREILADSACPFPRALLETRIRWLEESVRAVRSELSSSSVRLVRP